MSARKCLKRRLIHLLIFSGAAALSPALAQDSEQCFSKYTRFNICQKAREIQVEFAKSLPQKMSNQVTASAVAVVGPRLILTATWQVTRSGLDERIQSSGMTPERLLQSMDTLTQNLVCSQETMAAFIRLGGEMQYVYRTLDGQVVASPSVRTCPAP